MRPCRAGAFSEAVPVLAREPDVQVGRINMTTRRLRLVWHGTEVRAESLVDAIERDGRPVERLTVGELLALVATASEVQA